MFQFSNDDARLLFRFEKPHPVSQGMAVWEDLLFQLFHTGLCSIYDLKAASGVPLITFPLGSYNPGIPTADYTNHGNLCMFSTLHHGDNPIPVFYATIGNGAGADEDGFFYRCAAENIRLTRKGGAGRVTFAAAETLQVIRYRGSSADGTPWEQPCWGAPLWLIDSAHGALYVLSARWRTTSAFREYRDRNAYIVTKFPLPDPEAGGIVTLTAADIADQFTAPFDIFFTQGGLIAGGKIFYTFGAGTAEYPNGVRVYDLRKRCLCAGADLSGTCLGSEEIEACGFRNGELLCTTNAHPHGGIYSLGSRWSELLAED